MASQESGRGGRDGKPCISLLYCSQSHLKLLSRLGASSASGNVAAVADYAMATKCRRQVLLAHFGEHRAACKEGEELCDTCAEPQVATSEAARRNLGRAQLQLEELEAAGNDSERTTRECLFKSDAQQLSVLPRGANPNKQFTQPVLRRVKRSQAPNVINNKQVALKKQAVPFKIPWRKSPTVKQGVRKA